MREGRRYTGRERRQRALLRLSVILWVSVCCIVLCSILMSRSMENMTLDSGGCRCR